MPQYSTNPEVIEWMESLGFKQRGPGRAFFKSNLVVFPQEAEMFYRETTKAMIEARINELENLGYDKRHDDPILHCAGDNIVISRQSRIEQLKGDLAKAQS